MGKRVQVRELPAESLKLVIRVVEPIRKDLPVFEQDRCGKWVRSEENEENV